MSEQLVNGELLNKLIDNKVPQEFIDNYLKLILSPVSYNNDKDKIVNIVKFGLNLNEERFLKMSCTNPSLRKECAIDICIKIYDILYANQIFLKTNIKCYLTCVRKLNEIIYESSLQGNSILTTYLQKFKDIAINDKIFMNRLKYCNKNCYNNKYSDVIRMFTKYNLRPQSLISYKKFY
jgi:hypothetical protein